MSFYQICLFPWLIIKKLWIWSKMWSTKQPTLTKIAMSWTQSILLILTKHMILQIVRIKMRCRQTNLQSMINNLMRAHLLIGCLGTWMEPEKQALAYLSTRLLLLFGLLTNLIKPTMKAIKFANQATITRPTATAKNHDKGI
jgi:hypothetical protein